MIDLNPPDTEVLDAFMKEMETFMMLNWEKLEQLDADGPFEQMKMDAEKALAHLKMIERSEDSDDPRGYGDWREANQYAE